MLGPIFTRELVTVPRRASHYASRAALLGLIGVLGATAWQATVGFTREATLGEAARFGLLLFQIVVYVQLLLLIFFAALSAASAVSQEKDRRTFVLLLITDMRDYEIVLGKLLGALLPITVLLMVSVPALSLMLLLGGIDPSQVIQATAVMLTTAFAAGSLGGLVALWRERTFQALALSVLFLALYLSLTQAVGAIGPMISGTTDWGLVQSWIDPFMAMRAVLDPPPGGWSGLPPAYGFSLVMLGWCVVLNGLGITRLRRWNPSGEPVMQREGPTEDPEANLSPEELKTFRSKAHAAPGTVRQVWENPVLWREVRTLAYGRRPLLVKLAFGLVLALVLYFAVETLYQPGGRPAFAAAYGLVPIAVLSLLLVAAQAVTSVTSERDTNALDVLLVTDISPYEFVFGKLLGAIYNTKEYLIPPLVLAVYYAVEGLYAKSPPGAGWWDRLTDNFGPMLTVLGALVVLFAFVLVLGLHVSLRLTNSRLAIVHTLGTVFFLSVGTLITIYMVVINTGSFANQWLSFIAFLAVGIGGLLYVLSADRPSPALSLASVFCPLAMFYCVTNILIAKPGTEESADPLVPFMALAGAFGFAVAAMLVPLLSEFDVALGRTSGPQEE
ncbi:MAG TPA: ABC transporter permease subunit [Fimbriiglobus sp.]|nr:ABC transporter permease subunit [Fimbriiglobus sp.]